MAIRRERERERDRAIPLVKRYIYCLHVGLAIMDIFSYLALSASEEPWPLLFITKRTCVQCKYNDFFHDKYTNQLLLETSNYLHQQIPKHPSRYADVADLKIGGANNLLLYVWTCCVTLIAGGSR